MTSPFTTAVAYDPNAPKEDREYIPFRRTRGLLIIARPLEWVEKLVTVNAPEGSDVVIGDFAVLDPIPEAMNDLGEKLPGFPAGFQFRKQVVFPKYLIGTFKRYLDKTLIGTTYFGPKVHALPPLMWQDWSGEAEAVRRGQEFLAQHPEFLIPQAAAFSEAVPEQMSGPPAYQPPPRPGAGSVYTQHSPGAGPATQNTLEQMRAMAKANGPDQEPPF